MAGTVVNPSTPYIGPVQGGLQDGMSISVSGNLEHHHNGFLISLQAGGCTDPRSDTAFVFNPRFTDNQVVRNSLQSGSWGAEERHGGFPFQKGQNCEVTIHVKQNAFKVSVNGRHFCDYNHRMPKHRVTHITVEQGIRINTVKFEHPGHHHGGGYPQPGAPAGAYPGGGAGGPIYNPPVPFNQTIPGGLYPGKMIFISGIPNPNPSRFSIHFDCGRPPYNTTCAFVLDVRFNFGNSRNVLVRNTKVNDAWGTEERTTPYFPFAPDQFFDMIILVENQSYKIAVNNQHLLEFAHRLHPLGQADTLNITGDVRLTQIRYQ